ncbi:MAG: ribonuclease HII [Candidatus Omnitrophica bacterium 4484_70.1]|nr:MAG: ribonuclease HII [Candidatus Omnitrophica bacterium 4484_70.1]
MQKIYIIGVDEAGLGPVIGPLVVSGICVATDNLTRLEKIGVKDSKLFGSSRSSRERRRKIWGKTKNILEGFVYRIISAKKISKFNMYDLEIFEIAQILTKLRYQQAERIYIAQLGYLRRQNFLHRLKKVKEEFSSENFVEKLIYQKDADSKFIPVSAASILSKVVRDREVLKICRMVGEEYVSGYPNKKTEEFLQRYWEKHKEFPHWLRRRNQWPVLCRWINNQEKKNGSSP